MSRCSVHVRLGQARPPSATGDGRTTIRTVLVVSSAPPVIAARLARWPFALLAVLLLAALWLFDTHQPAAWPDAATPWFAQVRALSPATWALDQLNARVPLAPDVPLGSALVLLATVLFTLATLLAIEVPAVLAIAVAVGLAATRSLWSTVSPGHDALPIAAVACAVAALARPIGDFAWAVPALATIVFSPPATWLVLPASVGIAVIDADGAWGWRSASLWRDRRTAVPVARHVDAPVVPRAGRVDVCHRRGPAAGPLR